MSELTSTTHAGPGLNTDGRKRLWQVFATVLIYAACLFIPAGTWRWPAAWVYLVLFVGGLLVFGRTIIRKHPEVINERGRASAQTKPYDRLFGRLYLPLALAPYVVAGLDLRFAWSEVPLLVQLAGFAGVAVASILPYWVMLVNAHAATTVRVETQRGQTVVQSGPYAAVRHPMYSGMIASSLCLPLALGSWWALVPSLLGVALVVWRTGREDETLREELPGYADYAARVRYRLLPGVW